MKKSMLWIIPMMLLTTACGKAHQNPITHVTEERAGHLLYQASRYAERSMHMDKLGGYGYQRCMAGELDDKTCSHFYHYMLTFAKQHDKQFKTLRLNDLINPNAWNSVKDIYLSNCFIAMD